MTGFWIFLTYLLVAAAVAVLVRVQARARPLPSVLIGLAWLPGLLMYLAQRRK